MDFVLPTLWPALGLDLAAFAVPNLCATMWLPSEVHTFLFCLHRFTLIFSYRKLCTRIAYLRFLALYPSLT